MEKTTLAFPHNSRTTYTAVKNLFRKQTGFSSVKCNDDLFVIEARQGAWISPFSENIKIKVASPENAAELLDIYKFYVENTAISFEIETPTLQEFRARIEKTLKKYPYLIAVSPEDEILGYAYASELKSRAAYDWSIETSIYVKKEYRKMGIGGILLKNLEFLLKKQNILNCYACIAYTEREY